MESITFGCARELFSGWEVEEIEKMRKLKLSILDIVNLILMVIGLILLAQRLTSPQFILPFGLIALVEEPLVILWAIGAVSEVVALVFKSRTAKISTLFLLAFTIASLLAVTPDAAMHAIAHVGEHEYEVQGTLNLTNLDKLEIVYDAKSGILYKYSFTVSERGPIHCSEITGLAAREDVNHKVTVGEVKPPRSGAIYFAACVLELDENWKHEISGTIEKTPAGYLIKAGGRIEKVLDIIAFLEHNNILIPIVVSIISTLVTVYIAHTSTLLHRRYSVSDEYIEC